MGRMPRCANCDKPYGRRDLRVTRFTVELGQPIPLYEGTLRLVSETCWPKLPAAGAPDDTTHFVAMDAPPHMTALETAAYSGRRGRRVARETWDGVTYLGPYMPFCTLRCALAFAQAAHAGGFRRDN